MTDTVTQADRLKAALEPFAAMGRVMETRARMTLGITPKDSEIVCESSGEAGLGILTMGHFRDAAALLPDAPGWGGMYKPLSREPLSTDGGAATPMREAASSVGADALAHLESEARRFAGFYKPNSDMANTLNILGNKIAALALSTAQVSTPGEQDDDE
jgi:hypothetical protein